MTDTNENKEVLAQRGCCLFPCPDEDLAELQRIEKQNQQLGKLETGEDKSFGTCCEVNQEVIHEEQRLVDNRKDGVDDEVEASRREVIQRAIQEGHSTEDGTVENGSEFVCSEVESGVNPRAFYGQNDEEDYAVDNRPECILSKIRTPTHEGIHKRDDKEDPTLDNRAQRVTAKVGTSRSEVIYKEDVREDPTLDNREGSAPNDARSSRYEPIHNSPRTPFMSPDDLQSGPTDGACDSTLPQVLPKDSFGNDDPAMFDDAYNERYNERYNSWVSKTKPYQTYERSNFQKYNHQQQQHPHHKTQPRVNVKGSSAHSKRSSFKFANKSPATRPLDGYAQHFRNSRFVGDPGAPNHPSGHNPYLATAYGDSSNTRQNCQVTIPPILPLKKASLYFKKHPPERATFPWVLDQAEIIPTRPAPGESDSIRYDDSRFPCEHKLGTSQALTQAMAAVRNRSRSSTTVRSRMEPCPILSAELCHNRFLPSTRGDLHLKYRDLMSRMRRQDFCQWECDLSSRLQQQQQQDQQQHDQSDQQHQQDNSSSRNNSNGSNRNSSSSSNNSSSDKSNRTSSIINSNINTINNSRKSSSGSNISFIICSTNSVNSLSNGNSIISTKICK